MDGSREMARARNELQRTPMFLSLFHEMETMFVRPTAGPDEPFIYGHPKLEKLQDVVLNHFRDTQAAAGSSVQVSTRVMIFSSFRDSVQEIAAMLNRHAPLIRVMTFMGQSSAGKGVKGFTQKEQLEVVQRFRLGDFNTLVSTCVGEEGLDIGEVDLIICFDAQRSPIRLVQRMGRTGRQRQGRIVVILAEGREERTYNTSQSNRRSVFKSIGGNQSGLHMYPSSPRMLPEDLHPTLHKMHITSGQFNQRGSSDTRRSSRGRRSRSGGQSSLIHPQNFAEMETQPSVSDGFLSSSEYSIFTSTMELGEQEAHPTLATSHFLSLPEEPVNLVSCSRPSRVLSLWEWRHWQCKQLPTHQVDHSLRCQNFVQLMALMDTMKDESEGECLYEQQLVSHNPVLKTRPDQHVTRKRPKTKTKQNTLAPTFKLTSVNQEVQETRTFLTNSSTQVQIGTSVPDVSGPPDFEEEVQEVRPSGDAPEQDDQELQAQFYLPSWDPDPPKGVFGDNETHKLILANVTELLSRSPPPLLPVVDDFLEIPEPEEPQPFMVSFTLDVDDDDDDGEEVMDEELQGLPDLQPAMVRDEVNSPTWDDLFDNDDEDEDDGGSSGLQELDQEVLVDQREATDASRKDMKGPDRSEDQLDFAVDQSIDLFTDEDFLQMTIPDVPTPEDTEHTENPNASTSLTTEAQVHSDNRTPGDSRSTDRSSHDHFSVNFDLGYSLDSEEEEGPLIHSPDLAKPPESSKPAAVHCSTPQNLLHTRSRQVPFLTPPSVQRPAAAKTSPLAQSARVTCRPEQTSRPTPAKGPEVNFVSDFSLQPDDSDSEEEEVVTKRRRQHKLVFSPDSTNASVADSPLLVGRRRAKLLDTSEQVDDDDGDDFQRPTAFRLPACESNRLRPPKARTKPRARNPARHFLDEEAELSDDEQVSSDEEDGDDQNHSLDGFVVNNTHLSQGLNDSEMQGVYLKSVKSPAPGGRFKMSYRNLGNMDVFSQVPEQDETYAEDSFVVGSEEEEEEEQIDDAQEEVVDLMPENSYVDGRRQYATRRRVLQHRVRAGKQDLLKPTGGTKKTRLIRVVDSSEEEVEGGGVREEEPPPVKPSSSSSQGRDPPVIDRCRKSVELQHQLSDQLDFTEVENRQAPAGQKPASESASRTSLVRILVDGRCIGSSAELIARLRHHHGATVHVCSLDGSYFIVSNRTAVERHLQSNLAAMQNRKRLTERVTSLLSRFERVCLIVEKDRTKPGETPRPFQRTRYYDSTVAALVSSGVRLLWSDSTEESTNLLAELGRLELRKGHGIDVNPEVKVQRQRALQFCQNLPSVNRVQALYMTQNFPSMVALARSSVESLQKGARLSRHRAEELFRFLRYSCDSFVLSSLKSGKGS